MTGKKLTANTLKLTAIAAMVADHVAVGFLPVYSLWYIILRTVGKITMPVMSYFIAEGYFHTHNLKKYMMRLLTFAALSHFPYVMFFSEDLHSPVTTSIMLPLLLGLCALWLYDKKPLGKWRSYALILVCFLLSAPCDWSCMPVFFVLLFGMYRDTPKMLFMRYSIVCAVFGIFSVIQDITNVYMGGLFLAIPLLAMYSGEKGRGGKILKWGFYLFYPMHLIILYIIKLMLL